MAKDPLELETRRRIFSAIDKRPGSYMRELGKELTLAPGSLDYHLNYLEKQGLIVAADDGYRKRYYLSEGMAFSDAQVLSVLRQRIQRRILIEILLQPGITAGELAKRIGIGKSTMSFHLKKIEASNLVDLTKQGRTKTYTARDPDTLAKVLITYKASFLDDVVDRFVETWLNL